MSAYDDLVRRIKESNDAAEARNRQFDESQIPKDKIPALIKKGKSSYNTKVVLERTLRLLNTLYSSHTTTAEFKDKLEICIEDLNIMIGDIEDGM